MLKKLIFCLVIVLTTGLSTANSQPYKTGLGIRLGSVASGISVRHFTGGTGALEGIASFGGHAFLITGLYESFHPFPSTEGLSWFWGGGAHIGFYRDHYHYFYYDKHGHEKEIKDGHGDHSISFGGDFILGMDYKFQRAPINLSLDVKPMIDFVPGIYGYWDVALSFRFTL